MLWIILPQQTERRLPVGRHATVHSLDKRQRPMHQVQAHVCVRIPLFQAVHLDAMLTKLRVAQVRLLLAQVRHLLAPLAVEGFRIG